MSDFEPLPSPQFDTLLVDQPIGQPAGRSSIVATAVAMLVVALVASAVTWVVKDRADDTERAMPAGLPIVAEGPSETPPSSAVPPTTPPPTSPPPTTAPDEERFPVETTNPFLSFQADGPLTWRDVRPPTNRPVGGDATMVAGRATSPTRADLLSDEFIDIWADDGRAFFVDSAFLIDGVPGEAAIAVENTVAFTNEALLATRDEPIESVQAAVLSARGIDPTITGTLRTDQLWLDASAVLMSGTADDDVWPTTFRLLNSLGNIEFIGASDPVSGPTIDIRWSGHSTGEPRLLRLHADTGAPIVLGIGPLDAPSQWTLRIDLDLRRIDTTQLR